MHFLVEQGKVLYLGISDTPAWIVSAANTYAIENGKTPFSVYQGKWCLADRSFERDIIPMAQHFGMALAPWGVLGGGMYQTKKALEERKKKGESLRGGGGNFSKQSEADIRVSEALAMVSSFFFLFSPIYTFANFDSPMIKVAEQHGIESVTAIALAYVIAKAPKVFPIVGGRKIEHLKDNIQALSIQLTSEQIKYLESIVAFDIGFPLTMIGDDPTATGTVSGILAASGSIEF